MLHETQPPTSHFFWTGFLFEIMRKVLGESKHQEWLELCRFNQVHQGSCGAACFSGS